MLIRKGRAGADMHMCWASGTVLSAMSSASKHPSADIQQPLRFRIGATAAASEPELAPCPP